MGIGLCHAGSLCEPGKAQIWAQAKCPKYGHLAYVMLAPCVSHTRPKSGPRPLVPGQGRRVQSIPWGIKIADLQVPDLHAVPTLATRRRSSHGTGPWGGPWSMARAADVKVSPWE